MVTSENNPDLENLEWMALLIYKEKGHWTSLLSDSLAKLELGTVTKCNFAGDGKTGASWTDNIMAQKSSERNTEEIGEQGDGAEDEEWVGEGDSCGAVVWEFYTYRIRLRSKE